MKFYALHDPSGTHSMLSARPGVAFLFSMFTAAVVIGQSPIDRALDRPRFFSDSERTSVCRASESVSGYTLRSATVTVVDRVSGRRIGDLRESDFSILQEGSEISIAGFKRWNAPMSAVLAIDTSISTASRLGEIGRAADTIVGGLSVNDRLSVITFDGGVTRVVDTRSVRDLSGHAIHLARSSPGTKLFDAVDFALKTQLQGTTGRKLIIILTDGEDNSSTNATESSTLQDANEADVLIYSLQYAYGSSFRVAPHPYLQQLAHATGGKVFSSSELTKSAENLLAILNEAAAQYTFCYWSAERDVAKPIKIKLRDPNAKYAIRIHGQ